MGRQRGSRDGVFNGASAESVRAAFQDDFEILAQLRDQLDGVASLAEIAYCSAAGDRTAMHSDPVSHDRTVTADFRIGFILDIGCAIQRYQAYLDCNALYTPLDFDDILNVENYYACRDAAQSPYIACMMGSS